MLLPNPTHGHQVTAGESGTRMADEQYGMSILCKCKSVHRLPQHALTTYYCSSCSLQPHLDWLYSSDVRAQPSTAKGNCHAPRERRDY